MYSVSVCPSHGEVRVGSASQVVVSGQVLGISSSERWNMVLLLEGVMHLHVYIPPKSLVLKS